MTDPTSAPRPPLSLVTAESALATVFNVLTGGAFLSGLALLWGADDFQIGLLTAIPFLTPLAQIASAYLINCTGERKRLTVVSTAISRQVWWLLLPFLFIPCGLRLTVLIAVIVVCSVAINFATVGWTSWISDLVPERTRGRFFATRSMAVAIATFIATMGGGAALDLFRSHGHEMTGFAVILAAAGLFALAAVILLRRTPDCACQTSPGWGNLFIPLRDRKFRRLMAVFFVWNLAIGVSAPFMAPHMITNLHMSFTQISLYNSAAALMAILLNRPWGALIDRFGCKPVVALTSACIPLIPLIWLFPTGHSLWILIPEVAFSASLWAGFNLAAFNIPIAHSPNGRRTSYLALFSMITGFAFFGASILGGLLARRLAGMTWQIGGLHLLNYHILFVISATLRFAGGFALRTFHETGEQGVFAMLRYITATAARSIRRHPALPLPVSTPAPVSPEPAAVGER